MRTTLANTFWVLILAFIALFAFFLALGAFKPAEVVTLSLVMLGLTVLWIGHAMWDSRHRTVDRDPATIRNRERRGF